MNESSTRQARPGGEWTRVASIFHAALEQESSRRSAFVADACGSDLGLRREVESLLEQSTAEGDILEHSARAVAMQLFGEEAADEHVGRQIDGFRIESPLGRHAVGRRYLARHVTSGRKVRLEVLPEAIGHDGISLWRLARAVHDLRALNQPDISAPIGMVASDGVQAIVLEWPEAELLSDRLARGPMTVSATLRTVRMIATALARLHAAGVCHGRLLPEHVWLAGDDSLKLADFDFTWCLKPGLVGSDASPFPAYHDQPRADTLHRSRAAGLRQADVAQVQPADDVWALGWLLCDMVSGQSAQDGEGTASSSERFRPPLPPATPPPLVKLIGAVLHENPARRLQDLADLTDRLSAMAPDAAAGKWWPRAFLSALRGHWRAKS